MHVSNTLLTQSYPCAWNIIIASNPSVFQLVIKTYSENNKNKKIADVHIRVFHKSHSQQVTARPTNTKLEELFKTLQALYLLTVSM